MMIWILIGINLLSFFLCGLDKKWAKHGKQRIEEKLFFAFILLGGSLGFLIGMFLFHHKTKHKKFLYLVPLILFLQILLLCFLMFSPLIPNNHQKYKAEDFGFTDIKSTNDQNKNGIDDFTDIVLGAKAEAKRHPVYKSAYYRDGYPPETEGVCTDVIWRAMKQAGYQLKDLVDEDILKNTELYPRVAGKPDSNIDFRRVKNLKAYFERNSTVLTNDITKIEEWMPGDIVIFGKDSSHIAIVSDIRNKAGIPWIIHNAGQKHFEEDTLRYWEATKKVTGHYRFERDEKRGI